MGLFEQFPYTNFHELNLSWVLEQWAIVRKEFTTIAEAFADLKEFVDDYFDNLDVQEEINNKLDEMYADGTLALILNNLFTTFENTYNAKLVAINNKLYATPEEYGAVGDGITDDTAAMQAAMSDARHFVVFGKGKVYKVTATVRIAGNMYINMNGSEVLCTDRHFLFNFQYLDSFTGYNGNGNIKIENGQITGGAISFIHAANVQLSHIRFKDCLNDHFLEICACSNYTVDNCIFSGMVYSAGILEYINIDPCYSGNFPWFDPSNATYDGTPNRGIRIHDCVFTIGGGAYAYGQTGVGVHSAGANGLKHENVLIENNSFYGFSGYSIRLNQMDHSAAKGNIIYTNRYGIQVGFVASDYIVIDSNIIYGMDPNTARRAIVIGTAGATHLFITNNRQAQTILQDQPMLNIDASIDDCSFDCLQEVRISGQVQTENTHIDLLIKPTMLTDLWITVGSIGRGIWETAHIRSYFDRGFDVGEQYKIMCVNDTDDFRVVNIEITSTGFDITNVDNINVRSVSGAFAFK